MEKNHRGWNSLIQNMRADLNKIAPGLHLTEISESNLGGLQVYYSAKGLTPQQQVAVDARVKRAEEAAWQSCVICGSLGSPAYIFGLPYARVFCEEHKPTDWNFIN